MPPPPRAFTQGVGLVFQVAGVLTFLAMSFVCCGSSLLSKDWATQSDLTHVGWRVGGDAADRPAYSAQQALTISVFAGVFFGLATASLGLGMQAEHRHSAAAAAVVTAAAAVFWIVHATFAATAARSVAFTLIAGALAAMFVTLCGFAIAAARELKRNPPPPGHELLPASYKIPYSHYHADPPEVRLAAELAQRRERLAVEQKEVELLEEKLRRKLDDDEAAKRDQGPTP